MKNLLTVLSIVFACCVFTTNIFGQNQVEANRIQCLDKNCNGDCDNGEPILKKVIDDKTACIASCVDADKDGACDQEKVRVQVPEGIKPTPTMITVGTVDPVCDGCIPVNLKTIPLDKVKQHGTVIQPQMKLMPPKR